jgi:hypothetical protein
MPLEAALSSLITAVLTASAAPSPTASAASAFLSAVLRLLLTALLRIARTACVFTLLDADLMLGIYSSEIFTFNIYNYCFQVIRLINNYITAENEMQVVFIIRVVKIFGINLLKMHKKIDLQNIANYDILYIEIVCTQTFIK